MFRGHDRLSNEWLESSTLSRELGKEGVYIAMSSSHVIVIVSVVGVVLEVIVV